MTLLDKLNSFLGYNKKGYFGPKTCVTTYSFMFKTKVSAKKIKISSKKFTTDKTYFLKDVSINKT